MAVQVDPGIAVHRLGVAEFRRMIDAGILGEDDRVELIDGVLVQMSPQGPAHVRAVVALNARAVPAAAEVGLRVVPQSSVDIADPASLPEPDVAIAPTPQPGEYPTGAVLVVEVAASSLALDLGRKAALYAEAGVPEYWVLDLTAGELVVHRGPGPHGYAEVRRLRAEDRVTAVGLPLTLTVGDLL